MSINKRRCSMDGGTCHHGCDVGECFRSSTCVPLTSPHEGFPQRGKYEAKIESTRVVSIEWSGAIFDTASDARRWAARMKKQWVSDGVDPSAIRIEVSVSPSIGGGR